MFVSNILVLLFFLYPTYYYLYSVLLNFYSLNTLFNFTENFIFNFYINHMWTTNSLFFIFFLILLTINLIILLKLFNRCIVILPIILLFFRFNASSNFMITQLDYTYKLDSINLLLINSLNNIHPPLLYISVSFITLVSVISILRIFIFKYILICEYFYILSKLLLVTSVILGSWWALLEGTWGGWWDWDVSELLSILFIFLVLIAIHGKWVIYGYVNRKKVYSIFLKILLMWYLLLQINYKETSHSFISNSDYMIYLYILFLIMAVIFLLLNLRFYYTTESIISWGNSVRVNIVLTFLYITYLLVLLVAVVSILDLLDFFKSLVSYNLGNFKEVFIKITLLLLAIHMLSIVVFNIPILIFCVLTYRSIYLLTIIPILNLTSIRHKVRRYHIYLFYLFILILFIKYKNFHIYYCNVLCTFTYSDTIVMVCGDFSYYLLKFMGNSYLNLLTLNYLTNFSYFKGFMLDFLFLEETYSFFYLLFFELFTFFNFKLSHLSICSLYYLFAYRGLLYTTISVI